MVGLEASFDAPNGGWGGAPKFPQPMTIEFLLRPHLRTGDARPLGDGPHDARRDGRRRHLRPARRRLPPLRDRRDLAGAALREDALRQRPAGAGLPPCLAGDRRPALPRGGRGDARLRGPRAATAPTAAFAASQDADTEGEEGATYIWTAAEVRDVLGDDAPLFIAGVRRHATTATGRARRSCRGSEPAAGDDGGRPGREARLADARADSSSARATRPQPARDDKVLAAWNGLMIAAFADAARLAAGDGADRYRAAARALRTDPARACCDAGRPAAALVEGRPRSAQGVLEDYANLADGLLALYEATFDERWFVAARELADAILAHFADPAGGFFDTADDHEALITRPKDLQDNAAPSGNSMAATVLLRLAALTGEARYRAAAERALATVTPYPALPDRVRAVAVGRAAGARRIVELAVVGDPDDPATQALLEVACAGCRADLVVARSRPTARVGRSAARRSVAIDGRPTAYVCRAVRVPAARHRSSGARGPARRVAGASAGDAAS